MKKVKSKKNVIRTVTEFRQYNLGTLDEFIASLIKIRDAHSGHEGVSHYIDFTYEQYYDDISDIRLAIHSERVETEKEAADREAEMEAAIKEANRRKREAAKKAREKREQLEREQYERLKKKYEK